MTFSQIQNRTWVIPDQELHFATGPTVSSLPNYSGSQGYWSHNAMQDGNGVEARWLSSTVSKTNNRIITKLPVVSYQFATGGFNFSSS